jgi:glutamate racemase
MRSGNHVVITDSGLGGLAVCAALEQGLRAARVPGGVRLTYVNAWPFEDRGYNDLPDVAARAHVFDSALGYMAAMRPDRIVIACNTLSILYPHTDFSHVAEMPVLGIVDAGVDLFTERLRDDPSSSIVLTGTKTTIESGAHRDLLAARGIDPARVAAVACHGLAAAIERDVDGPRTAELLDACAARAAGAAAPGSTLYLGLCCTHYGYVAGRFVEALAAKTGRPVRALDPGSRLVGQLLAGGAFAAAGRPGPADGEADAASDGGAAGESAVGAVGPRGGVRVEVISNVELSDASRHAIARLVEPVSPASARALLSYKRGRV